MPGVDESEDGVDEGADEGVDEGVDKGVGADGVELEELAGGGDVKSSGVENVAPGTGAGVAGVEFSEPATIGLYYLGGPGQGRRRRSANPIQPG